MFKANVDIDNLIYKLPLKYGWKRTLVFKKMIPIHDGVVYYYSPDNKKLQTLTQVKRLLDTNDYGPLTIKNFTFIKKPVTINNLPDKFVENIVNTRKVKPNKAISAKSNEKVKPYKAISAKSNEEVKPNKAKSAKSNKKVKPNKAISAKSNEEVKPNKAKSAKSNKKVKPNKAISAKSNEEVKPNKAKSAKSNKKVKPNKAISAKSNEEVKPNKAISAKSNEEEKLPTTAKYKMIHFMKRI